MRKVEEVLNELRDVQERISSCNDTIYTDFSKYDNELKEFTPVIEALEHISTGTLSMDYLAHSGRHKQLRDLTHILISFASDVANDMANNETIRILKVKEKILKDELGIK